MHARVRFARVRVRFARVRFTRVLLPNSLSSVLFIARSPSCSLSLQFPLTASPAL